MTGYLSWILNRRKIHLARVLDLLIQDLRKVGPDHAVLTGDIVNISALDEFTRATDWLSSWADEKHVSVIPGNHDAYVPVPWEAGIGLWSPYMSSLGPGYQGGEQPIGPADFPYTRILGDIVVIGVSSAVPMPPFVAAGRIGQDQMQRLRKTLLALRRSGPFRVVLVHHPPFPMPFLLSRKALLDARAFETTIAECGAEMILHGHTHIASLGRIGDVPVIGVPSASALASGHKGDAAYNIYHIERSGPNWRVTTEVRGLTADGRAFEQKGRFCLNVGSPVHA